MPEANQAGGMELLSLEEALATWLGPAAGRGHHSARRALFLGSGFTKSCWSGAPLFDDLKAPLRQQLKGAPTLPQTVREMAQAPANPEDDPIDPSELVQLTDHHLGRLAVSRAILSEPAGEVFRLQPPADPVRRPLAPSMPSAFRTLKDWRRVVETYRPTHLQPLDPRSPCLLLGRLISERVVDAVLSTNWDAYVELGCMLSGVRVGDGDERDGDKGGWLEALPGQLWVFETPQEAALRTRPKDAVALLKLHGGVRTMQDILDRLQTGRLDSQQANQRLRRAFLVSSEDLVHWRETNRWVAEVAGDTLRSHRVLTIGVSGTDPVVYRAFRERIREWEDAQANSKERQDPLPCCGTDYSPKLRLVNMLTAQYRGGPRHRVVRAGADQVLKAAYAWSLLTCLTDALRNASRYEAELADLLVSRCQAEVSGLRDDRPAPLIDLLCFSIGPGARWAAQAEERAPFNPGTPKGPFRRWWYVPWGLETRGGVEEERQENLREIAAFLAILVRGSELGVRTELEVEPWTGVVHLSGAERLLAGTPAPAPRANLLPLPWPWRARRSFGSETLRSELRDEFGWGPGRIPDHLARAPLFVVPIPAPKEMLLRELRVGGVSARLLLPPEGEEGGVERSGQTRTWLEAARWLLRG